MTEKNNQETLVYRLVERGDVRRLYLSVSPDRTMVEGMLARGGKPTTEDYRQQTESVIEQLRQLLEDTDFMHHVVMMAVFMADISKKQLVRLMMRDFFDLNVVPTSTPVTTYIPQCPADGGLIAIELYAVSGSGVRIGLAYREESITVEYHRMKWCYAGDITSHEEPMGAYERSLWAFRRMERVLESRNMTVENLVRTWIYQGNLTCLEGGTQRYMELNRARTDFFEDCVFLPEHLPPSHRGVVYPASTGIGTDDFDVTMSGIGFSSQRDDIIVVPLENPDQTSAFDYSAQYSPKSPKFARAMALAFDDACRIYISGTASITESASRFLDDPEAQTHQTLDNIARLVSGDNLRAAGINGFAPALADGNLYRVYVKKPEHYAKIRAVCESRLPQIPVTYTIADVCRPELLVEIEGVIDC